MLWLSGCVSNPYWVGSLDGQGGAFDAAATGAIDGAAVDDAVADGSNEAGWLADAACCPASCNGGCDGDTCVVIPDGDGAAAQCVAARPCRIDCSAPDSCTGNISCGQASTCKVQC